MRQLIIGANPVRTVLLASVIAATFVGRRVRWRIREDEVKKQLPVWLHLCYCIDTAS